MKRCERKTNLEIHHLRRDGGIGIENAQVLCQKCHSMTTSYGTEGKSPEPFSEEVRLQALKKSGNQCECTSDYRGCH